MDIRFTARTADGCSGHDSLADHARRRLQVRLMHRSDRGAPAGTVVDIGADAYDTIERTADRVGRLVEEQLRAADGRRLPSGVPEEITA